MALGFSLVRGEDGREDDEPVDIYDEAVGCCHEEHPVVIDLHRRAVTEYGPPLDDAELFVEEPGGYGFSVLVAPEPQNLKITLRPVFGVEDLLKFLLGHLGIEGELLGDKRHRKSVNYADVHG